MTDVFTKEKRSEVMSRIRSRGNLQTEAWGVLAIYGGPWHNSTAVTERSLVFPVHGDCCGK